MGSAGSSTASPANTSPESAPSPSLADRADRAKFAESIQATLGTRLTADEDQYGSGTHSPCSTAHATALSQACGAVAVVAGKDADTALTDTAGYTHAPTLRAVASRVQAAAEDYRERDCASAPVAQVARQACLKSAATIGQAFPDLRDGINLALAGR